MATRNLTSKILCLCWWLWRETFHKCRCGPPCSVPRATLQSNKRLERKNYYGLTLQWNYDKGYVDISMPRYIADSLKQLQHVCWYVTVTSHRNGWRHVTIRNTRHHSTDSHSQNDTRTHARTSYTCVRTYVQETNATIYCRPLGYLINIVSYYLQANLYSLLIFQPWRPAQ